MRIMGIVKDWYLSEKCIIKRCVVSWTMIVVCELEIYIL